MHPPDHPDSRTTQTPPVPGKTLALLNRHLSIFSLLPGVLWHDRTNEPPHSFIWGFITSPTPPDARIMR